MKRKEKYKKSILRNSCMPINNSDTAIICDAIHTLTHILLDFRELLEKMWIREVGKSDG